jgi:dihydrofolate synthase/folylpolyglutamate synthase
LPGEKAGIIKSGVPVFTSTDQPEALAVITATAARCAAPLTKITAATPPVSCALRGPHQVRNATLAAAVIAGLQAQLPVTAAQQTNAFSQVTWPGRLQWLRRGTQQEFLLDGAHNPDGIATLRAALEQDFPHPNRTLIFGALSDKDWRAMSIILAPLARRIITVPVTSPRTVPAADLAEACRAAHPTAAVQSAPDLATALALVSADPFVVIAGSLYLVGAALAELDPQFQSAADERALNEWGGRPGN